MCGGRPKAAAAAAAAAAGGGRRPFSQPLGNPNRELNSGPPKEKHRNIKKQPWNQQ